MELKNEKELLKFLKQNYILDIKKKDYWNPTDAYSRLYDMHFELKNRKTFYDDTMIEKTKYDKLMEFKRCRYIIADPTGVYSFDLKKIPEPIWQEKELPSSTEGWHSNKIKKTVGFINKNLAKKIG